MVCDCLDLLFEYPDAQYFFAEDRDFFLVLLLVFALPGSQSLDLCLVTLHPQLHLVELARLRLELHHSFVLFNELGAKSLKFFCGHLGFTLGESQLIFKLSHFLSELTRCQRFILVGLRAHRLHLLSELLQFQARLL